MSEKDLELTLDLQASAADVYRALTTEEGIAGWWTAACEMDAREGGHAESGAGEPYVPRE